jgi:hypothetical protein
MSLETVSTLVETPTEITFITEKKAKKKRIYPPLKLSDGKIYQLVCNITGKIYIGSTCYPLHTRLGHHLKDWRSYIRGSFHYISSYEIMRRGNYRIELLENFPCDNRRLLRERENHYIEQAGRHCVNKRKAFSIRNSLAAVAQSVDHISANPSQPTSGPSCESLAPSFSPLIDSQSIPAH